MRTASATRLVNRGICCLAALAANGSFRMSCVPSVYQQRSCSISGATAGATRTVCIASHLDPAAGIILHTENGMLGMGRAAVGPEIDTDLTNAAGFRITELPGAAHFHHPDSFAMMRGGSPRVCVLGAFQVSARGDLANWHTGAADAIPAVGGAMDLAIGAKQLLVMMTLFTKDGSLAARRRVRPPTPGRRRGPARCPAGVHRARRVIVTVERGGAPLRSWAGQSDVIPDRRIKPARPHRSTASDRDTA